MQADERDEAQMLDEAAVMDFLRQDPNFFLRNPSLIAEINLPHASGSAISLVERQVSILRERNVDTRRRMNELVHTARVNDELFAKTRSLTLALLDADTLQALNEVLATFMLVDFEADFVCAHHVGKEQKLDHLISHGEAIPFSNLLTGTTPLCTSLRREELETIFPNSTHEETGSGVLLPLALPVRAKNPPEPSGILCIGSRNPQRFTSDMDTLFVTYISQVFTKVFARLRSYHGG